MTPERQKYSVEIAGLKRELPLFRDQARTANRHPEHPGRYRAGGGLRPRPGEGAGDHRL